jgi:hypothetical protein
MNIFKLVGDIFVDNEKANKSIYETDSKAKKMAKTFGSGIKTIGKWGLALGTAGAAGAGAMFAVAKKTASALDEIDKASKRAGIAADSYQEMAYWASQNGIEQADMEKVIGRFNQRVGLAQEGSKKYSKALKDLNVDTKALEEGTLSTEDAFAQAISSLSNMEDGHERVAKATELFGVKTARSLLPALEDTGLSLEEAAEKAKELGIVQSNEAVAAGVLFTDTLDQTTRVLTSMGQSIGIAVLPAFTKLLSWVQEKAPVIRKWFVDVFENKVQPILEKVSDVVRDYVIPMFGKLKTWADTNMPKIKDTFKMVIEDYVIPIWNELYDTFNEFILPILQKVFDWVQEWIPVLKDAFKIAFDVINPIVKDLWTIFTEYILPILAEVFDWIDRNMPQIKETFLTVFNAVFDVIESVWNILDGSLLEVLRTIFSWVNDNMETIQGIFETVFGVIYDVVDGAFGIITDVIGALDTAIEKFKEFWTESKKTSEARDNAPSAGYYDVKGMRAGGGPVDAGDAYWVGEKEAEVFVPDSSGTIFNQNQLAAAGGGGVTVERMIVRNDSDIKRVARELFNLQQDTNRGNGGR